jgi:hypothetical protein
MAKTNRFPIEETILAVLMLVASAFAMVMYRNKQKEKKRIIDAIRSRIDGGAGVEKANDLASKLVGVNIDSSFNQAAAVKKLLNFDGFFKNDNSGIINYLSSLSLGQIKSIDIGIKSQTGKNLEQWLEDVLDSFTNSNCYRGLGGCEDFEKIMTILKNK